MRFGHVPAARIWYWQLVPRDVNLRLLGACFERAGILPSLRNLLHHCMASNAKEECIIQRAVRMGHPAPTEEIHGATHHVELDRGVSVLWIDDNAFFYVTEPGTGDDIRWCANRRLFGTIRSLSSAVGPPRGSHLGAGLGSF